MYCINLQHSNQKCIQTNSIISGQTLTDSAPGVMSLSKWLNRISEWFGLPWSMLVEAPATWSHSSKVLYTETLTELEGKAQIIQIAHLMPISYISGSQTGGHAPKGGWVRSLSSNIQQRALALLLTILMTTHSHILLSRMYTVVQWYGELCFYIDVCIFFPSLSKLFCEYFKYSKPLHDCKQRTCMHMYLCIYLWVTADRGYLKITSPPNGGFCKKKLGNHWCGK